MADAINALVMLFEPARLIMLFSGVAMGLVLGILPGIGGITGVAILLPFTFGMDPYAAFALLLGLAATTSTGDPIPAILLGVPGGAGSAATVLDGLPMAQRGEAGRALAAAYMSSLLGGVFGAFTIFAFLPVIRQFILVLGSPEMLAFTALGLALVATLSGSRPLRGMVAAGVGLIVAMVGSDPQTGTMRWTFGTLYLFDGVPLVPLVLGLFALPEIADLAVGRQAIAKGVTHHAGARGMLRGTLDSFRHWWLVLRCSSLGVILGAIPGIGASVIDWIAYSHALQTEKGARDSFGKGDVRGVIAVESANNAKEAGALIPTIAFGVPGSIGMAILLGAFMIHGLVPGPDMITKNISVTYSMVWSIALANIVGAGACYLLSPQFARIATLRYSIIVPLIVVIVFVGAFQGSNHWGDWYTLLGFGVLGWCMKRMRWPRPPLILGCVLGSLMESYLFISVERFGVSWLLRPGVIVLLCAAVLIVLMPQVRAWRGREPGAFVRKRKPVIDASVVFLALLLVASIAALRLSFAWAEPARIVPTIVLIGLIAVICLGLLNEVFPQIRVSGIAKADIHLDLTAEDGLFLSRRDVARRALEFAGWLIAFMACSAVVGLIVTTPVFVALYMLAARERAGFALLMAAAFALAVWFAFAVTLHISLPITLIQTHFPGLWKYFP